MSPTKSRSRAAVRARNIRHKEGVRKHTPEAAERARRELLELVQLDPETQPETFLRDLGYLHPADVLGIWRKQHPEWWKQLSKLRRVSSKGKKKPSPPAPGTFIEWRRKYINLRLENPITLRTGWTGATYDFQKPFCDALEDPSVRRIVELVPVRHGKTTIVEQYVVYTLCKNPNARIIVIARSKKHAEERGYAIQQMLLDDELFPQLHDKWGAWIGKPAGRSKPWSYDKGFYVRGRADGQRSPSISFYGIESDTYGARADLIILDDIDSPTTGHDTREGIWRALNGSIVTRLAEGGKLVIIGTRCGYDDIYSRLMDRPGWWVDVQRAIKEDGSALCPEMYTLEDLELMRAQDMNEFEFQMLLQNNPVPDGSMMFPPDLIDRCKDMTITTGAVPDGWMRLISLDPAGSQRAALIALAWHPETKHIRVLDVEAVNHAGYEAMFEMIQRFVHAYRPSVAVIEDSGSVFFSEYPQVQRFLFNEGCNDVVSFKTGKNKHDPRLGVGLVNAYMDRGMLTLPWGDQLTTRRMAPLVDDLLGWTPRPSGSWKYDTVMALWFGVNTIHAGDTGGPRVFVPDQLARRYGRRSIRT